MYHVELRHFPHNMWRFNLSDRELHAIVEPWARGQVIEFGEHRWNPQQATLTILEGPHIPLGQLTMGRGWRTAERQGTNVTDEVIASVRQALFAGRPGAGPGGKVGATGAAAPTGGSASMGGVSAPGVGADTQGGPPSDPFALAMQVAALLGPDAMRLLDAWRAAAASSPGLPPSDTLALAEKAIGPPTTAGD
jgi:hypothetical protein